MTKMDIIRYQPTLVTARAEDLRNIEECLEGGDATVLRCEVRDVANLLTLYYLIIDCPTDLLHAVRSLISDVSDWLYNAPDSAVIKTHSALRRDLEPLLVSAEKVLKPSKPRPEMSAAFANLVAQGDFCTSRGVQHGWLVSHFNCGPFAPNYFPYHGIVGIGHYAGLYVAQESLLLGESVECIVQGRSICELLRDISNPDISLPKELNEAGASLKQKCCFWFRTSITSFYSFFECYINSIATDYMANNPDTDKKSLPLLQGKKGRRYISIERRLEGIPGIIRGDGKLHLKIIDTSLRETCFKNLLGPVRDVRDSAMHNAPWKADIWKGPKDWEELSERAFESAIECAKAFWKACYPNRKLPEYLGYFDATTLVKEAETNVASQRQAERSLPRP